MIIKINFLHDFVFSQESKLVWSPLSTSRSDLLDCMFWHSKSTTGMPLMCCSHFQFLVFLSRDTSWEMELLTLKLTEMHLYHLHMEWAWYPMTCLKWVTDLRMGYAIVQSLTGKEQCFYSYWFLIAQSLLALYWTFVQCISLQFWFLFLREIEKKLITLLYIVVQLQEVNAACQGNYWNASNEMCRDKLNKVDEVTYYRYTVISELYITEKLKLYYLFCTQNSN